MPCTVSKAGIGLWLPRKQNASFKQLSGTFLLVWCHSGSKCYPNGFLDSYVELLESFPEVFCGLPFNKKWLSSKNNWSFSLTKRVYRGDVTGTDVCKWGNNCHKIVFFFQVLVSFLGQPIFHLSIIFTSRSLGDFYLPFMFALGATFRQ